MTNMIGNDICWMSAESLAELVRRRQISPVEIGQAFVDRITAVNPKINAIIDFDPDRILRDAATLTEALGQGIDLGPLHGVPYTLKEGCPKKGTSAASGLVPAKGRVATVDSAIAARLEKAGGLYLGKTNQAEAGYSASSTNHLYGTTRNPWNLAMTAGGSSSGAGAAVASGISPLAQGSDGGGSVRIPAAINGVVGFKPSIGRIPVAVLAGRFYTFVFNGTLTRTVRDSALMMNVVAGADRSDPLSLPVDHIDYLARLDEKVPASGWRIAWTPDFDCFMVDPEVASICEDALAVFRSLGCRVDTVELGFPDMATAMWDGLWTPAYAALADAFDWTAHAGSVDPQLLEVIDYGARVTTDQRNRADALRGQLWDRFADLMVDYDFIVSPTLSAAAFPLTQFAPDWLLDRPLREQLLGWLMTYPFNLLGTPSITVPAGWTQSGLPVGLQISGRLHADADVLRAAAAFEQVAPWSGRVPTGLD